MRKLTTLTLTAASVVLMLAVCVPYAAADGGAAHQTRQARPVLLGTSGGSASDLDGRYCCGGTLGGLLQDGQSRLYLLSNNHVLGRTNRASAGEDTVQPGLIDTGCRPSSGDVVADFTDMIEIDFDQENRVDAAIARVRSGTVNTDGTLLDIGTPATGIAEPAFGMSVQKSGRTSGHTTGQVIATNVSVLVSYPKKCGGRGGPAALMVDQFRISDGGFSTGGDSGSVILENASNPRAVGLLFAGSSTSTVANRMQNVLDAAWSVGPLSMAGGSVAGCGSNADCDDGDACTTDTCQANGACGHAPISCDDGDACTDDTCADGSCSHDVIVCDDGDACTDDSCLSGSGCDFQPTPGCVEPCGDGVCDLGAGEDCRTCPDDCDGRTRGRPSDRFCCGDDVDCADPRCGGAGSCTQAAALGPISPVSATPDHARAAKRRNAEALLSIPDVVGHGLSRGADGAPVIEVYLGRANAASRAAIPRALEGVPVRVEVTGRFVAY